MRLSFLFGVFSLLEGCSKSETKEVVSPKIEFFFTPNRPHDEVTESFAKELYLDLRRMGVSDADIDQGFYKLGKIWDSSESPQGAKDGKIHEMEIYRAANRFKGRGGSFNKLWGESYRQYHQALAQKRLIIDCFDCPSVDRLEMQFVKLRVMQSLQRSLGMDPRSPEALLELGLGSYAPEIKRAALQSALPFDTELDPQQKQRVRAELERLNNSATPGLRDR